MNTFMHKILSTSLLVAITAQILLPSLLQKSFAASFEPYTTTFVTTAYYSPLPDQSFYVTGSYERDKVLNGNGTNGASGMPVFEGMLAGPSTYAFGTQVDCGDVLTGTIADRGGAIVKAGDRYAHYGVHDHDRLDIWAGRGEAGLVAALQWGKRTLTCTVYPPGWEQLNQFVNLPQGDISAYAKRYTTPKTSIASTPNTFKPTVPNKYKAYLETLGYGSDEDNIAAFQIANKLVDTRQNEFAGIFGPNTKALLDTIFIKADNALPRIGLSENNVDQDVRLLQSMLHDLGYLDAEPTAIFGPQTKEALIKFQMDHQLIKSEQDKVAGYLGAGTLEKLKLAYLKPYLIQETQKNQIMSWKQDRERAQNERESIAAAEKLATEHPEDLNIGDQPDEFRQLLEELSKQWIEEHTPTPEEQAQKANIVLASAEKKVDASPSEPLEGLLSKLDPLFNPFQKHLTLGSVSPAVTKLQHFLTSTGHYDGELFSNYYGPKTRDAVIAFQLEYQIITSKKDAGAGIVGPKTVHAMNIVYSNKSYTLKNQQITNQIRKPAIHPDDLKEATDLRQASATNKTS